MKKWFLENFLLHDCGQEAGRNRILVFGRESNVRDAGSEENNIKHVIFDGTFSLTPKVYHDGKVSFSIFFLHF